MEVLTLESSSDASTPMSIESSSTHDSYKDNDIELFHFPIDCAAIL
jgi:hypothetical protein